MKSINPKLLLAIPITTLILLSGIMFYRSKYSNLTVIYDTDPWQDVTISASKINPSQKRKYEEIINNLSFIEDQIGNITYQNFSEILETDRIGAVEILRPNYGSATTSTSKGVWLILLLSDTSNRSKARIVVVDKADYLIDFRSDIKNENRPDGHAFGI